MGDAIKSADITGTDNHEPGKSEPQQTDPRRRRLLRRAIVILVALTAGIVVLLVLFGLILQNSKISSLEQTIVRFERNVGSELAEINTTLFGMRALIDTELHALDHATLSSEDATNTERLDAIKRLAVEGVPIVGLRLKCVPNEVYIGDGARGCQRIFGLRVVGTTLTDTDFSNLFLDGAEFTGSHIRHLRATHSIIVRSQFNATVLGEGDFDGAIMTASDFSGANLQSTSFVGANLTDSRFERSKLFEIDFSAANLRNVDFEGAALSDIDFGVSEISNTNFTHAQLDHVNWHGAWAWSDELPIGLSGETIDICPTELLIVGIANGKPAEGCAPSVLQ